MRFLIIILGFLLIFGRNFYPEDDHPSLIPIPNNVSWTQNNFIIDNLTAVHSEDVKLRDYLIQSLKHLTGLDLKHDNSVNKKNKIILKIDNNFLPGNRESYSLDVDESSIEITGNAGQGVFLGIQTLLQMIPPEVKSGSSDTDIQIPGCSITDKPAFSWRGLNLDCSRHFMTKDFIKRYIDILAYYKFNTFHWHFTDDQGWRIEIKKYPRLTKTGAWRTEADGSVYGGYYTQDDIKEIVKYAEDRFITIVPEIEMPGHSLASLASYPENSCTGGPFEVGIVWGVMKDIYCAGRDSTFYFLQNILDEVISLFPGRYIHIGGDEAPKNRWEQCPRCQVRIKAEGLKDEHELQSYFIKRISSYLNSKGKQVIGWDEILQGGLAPGAIVQSWQSFQGAVDAARLGHYTICSPASHTYLNSDPDDLDLRIAYSFNPVPDELTKEEKKFVIGSEANLWTEQAPQETVDSKLFPRILALAEVFWTDSSRKNYDDFYARLQDAYDDISALGINYGRESKVFTPVTSFDSLKKEFIVNVIMGQTGIDLHYTTDGTDPDSTSSLFSEPVRINNSATVKLAAFRENHFIGKRYSLSFDIHKALNAEINLMSKYDERYRAGGDKALVDGVRASQNLRDGLWQGYEGVDFESVIDLGETMEISEITPAFLLNSNSWIFLPEKVTIAIGDDKAKYSETKTILNDIPQKNSEVRIKEFPAVFSKQSVRYIKIKAENIKRLPSWHPGAGGKAWLFIDEIVVN